MTEVAPSQPASHPVAPEPTGTSRGVSPLGAVAGTFTAFVLHRREPAGLNGHHRSAPRLLASDATLRPPLALTLALKVAGSALKWCRPAWPIGPSRAAAVWI